MSAETEKAVELFGRREDAERFLDELQADDQELVSCFGSSRSSWTPRRLAERLRGGIGDIAPLT